MGTTLLARPMLRASVACTARPVMIRSNARERPTMYGNRTVPPSTVGTPLYNYNIIC